MIWLEKNGCGVIMPLEKLRQLPQGYWSYGESLLIIQINGMYIHIASHFQQPTLIINQSMTQMVTVFTKL